MRGAAEGSGRLFSDVDLEGRVPASHPLRAMRGLVNPTLAALDGAFCVLYAPHGRPLIPPERLLRAILLQLLDSIRSERQVVERLEFDLLFRWFVGLGVDAAVWDAPTFSRNRSLVLTTAIAQGFRSALPARPEVMKLLSAEHFSVDGTMLKAFASIKRFRAKDGSDAPQATGRNGERDFKAEAAFEPDAGRDDGPGCAAPSQGQGPGPGQGKSARRSRPWVAGEPQRAGSGPG